MDNRQKVGMLVAQRQEKPEDRSLRAYRLELQEDRHSIRETRFHGTGRVQQ
jgi:hypothetical protein